MKRTRKLLALLLAALMLMLLPMMGAFAADDADACPIIYVHGFMGEPVIADRDDPDSPQLWGPDMSAILNDVKDALPGLLQSLVKKDWDRFGDLALGIVTPYFSPIYFGNDGAPVNASGVFFRYPDKNSISKNSRLTFKYDWRRDPLELADDLHNFIDYVCDAAGTTQVNIHCHSFGSVVVVSYLTLYGNEKMHGVCFDSPALYGESYTGELMRGELTVSVESMMNYMTYAFDDMEYHALLNEVMQTAKNIGLIGLLVKLGEDVITNLQGRITQELMLPMFVNWLPIWSMVPDEDIDEAMHYVFDELGAGEDHAALKEKIEAYNTRVRPYKTESLQKLNEAANVYVIARTGYASIPLTPSHRTLSDGTVDTKYTSFGATTALYGEQLPNSVLQSTPAAYISPEKDIDASTCLFPEQTWFVRYAHHGDLLSAIDDFCALLLRQPTQATVETFDDYPRFLIYKPAARALAPDPGPQKETFFARVKEIFAELRLLLRQLISNIGK